MIKTTISINFDITPEMIVFANAYICMHYVYPLDTKEDLMKNVERFIIECGYDALEHQNPDHIDDATHIVKLKMARAYEVASNIAPELFADKTK